MAKNQALQLLGGITAAEFLAEYWQKKPLLIKNAISDFQGLLSPEELAGLACEDDVQSRIVEYINGKWHASHGPFDDDDFARLPQKPSAQHNWTLLVQSVNHYLPEAAELLQQFDFIPHARLDDLMVSYAPDGGGVGPHFDSYDVFLHFKGCCVFQYFRGSHKWFMLNIRVASNAQFCFINRVTKALFNRARINFITHLVTILLIH